MMFKRVNDYHAISEDGRFIISRTNHGERGAAYQAVRLGGQSGRTWADSVSLHVERGVDPGSEQARRDAFRKCREACEASE